MNQQPRPPQSDLTKSIGVVDIQTRTAMKLGGKFHSALSNMGYLQSPMKRPKGAPKCPPKTKGLLGPDVDQDETVTTEEDSSSVESFCTGQSRKQPQSTTTARKVNFSRYSEVIEVENYDDPALWWQDNECDVITLECLDLVEANRNGPNCIDHCTMRFLDQGWKDSRIKCRELLQKMRIEPQCRGLERHILVKFDKMMNDHVNNVLQIQRTSNSEYLLRLAARQTSQRWEELALVRGHFDAEACQSQRKPVGSSGSQRKPARCKSQRKLS